MRTTLTLDPDVAAELERRRRERETSLKQEVNDLLRIGLRYVNAPPKRRRPFRTQAASLGEQLVDIDDVAGALEHAEGPGWK
ncbi:MAG: hypothetical protein M3N16_05350 [Actinomycetota bacterium]|nr:hypothetical protein [Actinomycetota bacterium]